MAFTLARMTRELGFDHFDVACRLSSKHTELIFVDNGGSREHAFSSFYNLPGSQSEDWHPRREARHF
jgi:hypothetical protein